MNLKSAILRWSAVIPNALIGDPYAVFNLVVVGCIDVLKLLSIVWYVEYLMRDMTAPGSIRALLHFPACTVIVGQSVMSATLTWSVEGSPFCSWESLLGEDSISLKDLIPLLSHWSEHQSCKNPVCGSSIFTFMFFLGCGLPSLPARV